MFVGACNFIYMARVRGRARVRQRQRTEENVSR